jgi:hypothetical protein
MSWRNVSEPVLSHVLAMSCKARLMMSALSYRRAALCQLHAAVGPQRPSRLRSGRTSFQLRQDNLEDAEAILHELTVPSNVRILRSVYQVAADLIENAGYGCYSRHGIG